MDKIKRVLQRQQSYQQLAVSSPGPTQERYPRQVAPFSWLVYSVFLLLGFITLLPWSALMTANPYLQTRFHSSESILRNFQPSELVIGTITNLGCVFILAKLQAHASYPRRIVFSLLINLIFFTLLAVSTRTFLGASTKFYLAFLLISVFATSIATGFIQNGSFAYVADYQRPEYMQSIMFGQAVAGVLAPVAQLAFTLSVSKTSGESTSTSAFAYFLTAAGACVVTLLAFFALARYSPPIASQPVPDNPGFGEPETYDEGEDEEEPSSPTLSQQRGSTPLLHLARRLFFPASAVFLTFAITMVFPVFTQQITTTNPNHPPILRDAAFIPLSLLVWNAGDLFGRLAPLSAGISLAGRPKILLGLSVLRVVFIPLYLLCNVQHAQSSAEAVGSVRNAHPMPDLFYLLVVQFPFGLSNGYLGSCCMMGAGGFVEEYEREAAGGFMGLVLVFGLAVGSLCSFFVGNL